ncbi:MAG: hypothetical protein Q9190_001657 [Brigantiaea leucoxantha]
MLSFQSFVLAIYGASTLFSSLVSADSTKSLQACTTLLGKSSRNPVPTVSVALTFTSKATLKSTSTPVTTLTPPPDTVTVSTTETDTTTTTLMQQTDTFFTTTTDTTTATFIPSTVTSTTFTSTTTSTAFAQTPTTTIQPSSGFIPASSAVHAKRDLEDIRFPRRAAVPNALTERAANPIACHKGKSGQLTFSPAVYPTQVACAKLVQVYQTITSVAVASTTSTITAAPGPASTTTLSFTATVTDITMPVDASTTVTLSTQTTTTTTVVPTTTVSLVSTTTVTVTPPQATYYAACGPNNQLETVNGVPIDGANFYNGAASVTASSAYDCCVACLNNPSCGASAYFGFSQCYVAQNGGTCNPANAVLAAIADGEDTSGGVFVSSSNCGTVKKY